MPEIPTLGNIYGSCMKCSRALIYSCHRIRKTLCFATAKVEKKMENIKVFHLPNPYLGEGYSSSYSRISPG